MADDHDIFARIPVEFRNGAWINENGRRLVAAPGTKAEFWIKQQALPGLWPRVDVAASASGQFLDKGSCLRFALSVRHKNQLTEELASHLILPHDMWHKVEWGPVKGWYSTDAHFIQVELGEPSDAQRAEFPSFTGGLLIKVRGRDITEIEPSSFDLPKGIEARKPQSLNHAYTILSEVYELHRASHTPPEEPGGDGDGDEPRAKIMIKLADGKTRSIRYIATTTYWSPEGKPISAQEFMERLFGDLTGLITDEDHLRKVWSDPDSRETFLKQLSDRGYDDDRLNDIRRLVDAPDTDLFDVLGYILFTHTPKTRHDRASTLKSDQLASDQDDLKALLISILDAYEANGESELAAQKLGQFLTARYGSVGEAKTRLGSLPHIKAAFRKMQAQLYAS